MIKKISLSSSPIEGDYKVLVTTSDDKDSGTDAKVTLTVFGDKGNSGPLPLEKDGHKEGLNLFVDGTTDDFQVSRTVWLQYTCINLFRNRVVCGKRKLCQRLPC